MADFNSGPDPCQYIPLLSISLNHKARQRLIDDSTPPGNQWHRSNNFNLHDRMSTLSACYSYHYCPDIPHGLPRGGAVFPRCTEPYIRLRASYLAQCHSGAILTVERHQRETRVAWLSIVSADYLQPPKPHQQFPGSWRCQVHNWTGTVSPPRQSSKSTSVPRFPATQHIAC